MEEKYCYLWLETSVNVSEKIHFREWFFNSLEKGAKPKKPRESNSKLATKNSVESTLQTNEYDGGKYSHVQLNLVLANIFIKNFLSFKNSVFNWNSLLKNEHLTLALVVLNIEYLCSEIPEFPKLNFSSNILLKNEHLTLALVGFCLYQQVH